MTKGLIAEARTPHCKDCDHFMRAMADALGKAEDVIDEISDELERLEEACVSVPSKKFFRNTIARYRGDHDPR